MDIFGKSADSNNYMKGYRERKSSGIPSDDEGLNSDDDLIAAFKLTKQSSKSKSGTPSPSLEGTIKQPQKDVKPAPRQKISFKPKNELDRLLADDDEDLGTEAALNAKNKPWQPPQFESGSIFGEDSRKPVPKERQRISKRESLLSSPKSQALQKTSSDDDDDEEIKTKGLPKASYLKASKSPVTASADAEIDNLLMEKRRKSPLLDSLDRKSRKSPKSPGKSLADDFDAMFPKKKSQTPTSELLADSKRSSTSPLAATDDGFESIFSRKATKSPLADGLEGRKKLTRSPSNNLDDGFGQGLPEKKPHAIVKKGSYISSLLDDDKKDEDGVQSRTETSYISKLLDTSDKPEPKTRKTSMFDDDENELASFPDQTSNYQVKTAFKPVSKPAAAQAADERPSSVCSDVERDPIMVEQKKKDLESRKQAMQSTGMTESEKANINIEEVHEAQRQQPKASFMKQQPSNQSYIKPVKVKLAKSATATPPDKSNVSFDSANDIRNYIYQEWKAKKTKELVGTMVDKITKQKEEELKKKKEQIDKKLENEVTFRTWKESKDEKLKQKLREQKKAEKLKEKEMNDKAQKRRDAEKDFMTWKEAQDEKIKEKKLAERKLLIDKKAQEQELKEDKLKDNESAFTGWKKKKDQEIKKAVKSTRQLSRAETEQKMVEARRREIEAEQQYEKWLAKKEQQVKRDQRAARARMSRSSEDNSPRPPWSPANKTIPYGR